MTAPCIGFVLLSNSANPIPSTRIAVLNMFPLLRAAGLDPRIVHEPAEGDGTPDLDALLPRLLAMQCRVVVFQKVRGASVERLARALAAAGIPTVYLVCDVVDPVMAELTDATVVVTDFLKSLYPAALQHKIRVVHDGIEHPALHKQVYSGHRGSVWQPLRAVLVTSAHMEALPAMGPLPAWLQVTIVGRYEASRWQRLQHARWTVSAKPDAAERWRYLRFLAHPRIRCVPWSAASVYQDLLAADIAIIPIDTEPGEVPGLPAPNWKVKSENRLTMKMCLGLPVISTPIPAYEPVIEQGRNGFLARDAAGWRSSLEALRDPGLREQMGRQARASVLQRYSMQEQARLLLAVFGQLLDKAARAGTVVS